MKILLVEDEELLLMGLELIIQAEPDMEVAGMARNGREALEQIRINKPDLVLLDIQMPVMDGIQCIREIRKLDADLPILILTAFNEEHYIFQGLAFGANGYLLKGMRFDILLQTIRDAMNNKYVLPAEVAANIAKYVLRDNTYRIKLGIKQFFEKDVQYRFTPKEQDIILLLLDKLSNKEIADKIFVTEGTLKNNLTAIYEKLKVNGRQEAFKLLQEIATHALND